MPNFKVFSETPSQLLAQVSQPTAASLLSQVSNSTAASLLTQVSNLTAASLVVQASNLTAASFLTQVSNSTAASLLTQVSNSTAASLLMELGARATVDSEVDVADTGGATLQVADTRNVLQYSDVTYTVRNTGATNSAIAALFLSADSVLFTIDPSVTQQTIAPTAQFFFVPGRFTKYVQIQYASLTATLTTSLSIYFQSHV